MMQNRHRGSNVALLMLAYQVFQLGTDNIPPVTLATLGLNVYLFLFPLRDLHQTCVSVQQVYSYGDWYRLLLSPFHHVDDWHLYFNMVSFLWKGVKLERKLGGAWFAYLLSVFSLLIGLVYLFLEAGLSNLTGDPSFNTRCAVGFSGVLFGLKVLNIHYNPGRVNYIMGLPVANRYACWVELVLIHILNPETSFVGHLSGILVGLLYTSGPLKKWMMISADYLGTISPYSRPNTYFSSSGYSGYRRQHPPQSRSNPRQDPHDSHSSDTSDRERSNSNSPSDPPQQTAGLSEEKQNDAAIKTSLQDQGDSTQTRPSSGLNISSNPSVEEMRRRRVQKLDIQKTDLPARAASSKRSTRSKLNADSLSSSSSYSSPNPRFNYSGYSFNSPSDPPQHICTAGLSEVVQIDAAVRASLQDQGYNSNSPSVPPHHIYTAGLSEVDQIIAAVRGSLQDQGYKSNSPSVPPHHIYTAGLSEVDQIIAAARASLQDQGGSSQTRPSSDLSVSSDPPVEELPRH